MHATCATQTLTFPTIVCLTGLYYHSLQPTTTDLRCLGRNLRTTVAIGLATFDTAPGQPEQPPSHVPPATHAKSPRLLPTRTHRIYSRPSQSVLLSLSGVFYAPRVREMTDTPVRLAAAVLRNVRAAAHPDTLLRGMWMLRVQWQASSAMVGGKVLLRKSQHVRWAFP